MFPRSAICADRSNGLLNSCPRGQVPIRLARPGNPRKPRHRAFLHRSRWITGIGHTSASTCKFSRAVALVWFELNGCERHHAVFLECTRFRGAANSIHSYSCTSHRFRLNACAPSVSGTSEARLKMGEQVVADFQKCWCLADVNWVLTSALSKAVFNFLPTPAPPTGAWPDQ